MTPLHLLGATLRDLLAVIPLPAVRVLFVAIPLVLLVWVVRLPPELAGDEPAAGWTGNLKIWAAAALVIQILIYALI